MNWITIIKDIQKSGLSREEIANKCNCSIETIHKLAVGKRGKNLSYQIANPLKELHESLLSHGSHPD